MEGKYWGGQVVRQEELSRQAGMAGLHWEQLVAEREQRRHLELHLEQLAPDMKQPSGQVARQVKLRKQQLAMQEVQLVVVALQVLHGVVQLSHICVVLLLKQPVGQVAQQLPVLQVKSVTIINPSLVPDVLHDVQLLAVLQQLLHLVLQYTHVIHASVSPQPGIQLYLQ